MQIAYLNLSAKDPGPAAGEAVLEAAVDSGRDFEGRGDTLEGV